MREIKLKRYYCPVDAFHDIEKVNPEPKAPDELIAACICVSDEPVKDDCPLTLWQAAHRNTSVVVWYCIDCADFITPRVKSR